MEATWFLGNIIWISEPGSVISKRGSISEELVANHETLDDATVSSFFQARLCFYQKVS